jgi:hypothetical protein
MIIKIDDKTLEKYQTNEELSKVIVDILNGNFDYPGITIVGEPKDSNYKITDCSDCPLERNKKI